MNLKKNKEKNIAFPLMYSMKNLYRSSIWINCGFLPCYPSICLSILHNSFQPFPAIRIEIPKKFIYSNVHFHQLFRFQIDILFKKRKKKGNEGKLFTLARELRQKYVVFFCFLFPLTHFKLWKIVLLEQVCGFSTLQNFEGDWWVLRVLGKIEKSLTHLNLFTPTNYNLVNPQHWPVSMKTQNRNSHRVV